MYNSKLYKQFKFGSFIFLILSLLFLFCSYYISSVKSESSQKIVRLYNQAQKLFDHLEYQKNVNSNLAAFAYNLISATSNIVYAAHLVSVSSNSVNNIIATTSAEKKIEIFNPYIKFTRYQEIDGTAFVMLGSRFCKVGEFVDGRMIIEIQPTFVKLGDQYYEVFKN